MDEEAALQLARARLRIQTLCATEVSSIGSRLIEEIKKAQQRDKQCVRVMNNKISKDDGHLKLLDGIVMQNSKYYIPAIEFYEIKLLMLHHDQAGPVGRQKTFELISRLCAWPRQFEDVQLYSAMSGMSTK